MEISNIERFNNLVNEYLKTDSNYKKQIENFQEFLKEYNLEDRVFNLYETNIDEFFEYALRKNIGTESPLTSHIAALKGLFGFLIANNLKFAELNGYIGSSTFRNKFFEKVEKTTSKNVLSNELLRKILCTIDEFIDEHRDGGFKNQTEEDTYFDAIIAQLFIKISLLIPLQTTQVLELELGDVKNSKFRNVIYNDIVIKVPNNLRKDIIYAVDYAEQKYGKMYKTTDKIFEYLYLCADKKGKREGINGTLPKIYKKLGLYEMLEKKSGGKRDKFLYPAGSYKKTAIFNMLSNGVNIVYLIKLTGLDAQTLLNEFDYGSLNDIDVAININNSLLACDYYEYL